MSEISILWQRLETVLRAHDPKRLIGLNSGVSVSDVEALEEALDTPLPEDFKKSLQIHDGQEWLDAGILGGAWQLLSSRKSLVLIEMYQGFMTDADLKEHFTAPADDLKDRGKIKNIMWNPKWLPIADNSGQMFLVDLDPEHEGVYGQVISYLKSTGPDRIVTKSFTAWLTKYVARYEKRFLQRLPASNGVDRTRLSGGEHDHPDNPL